MTHNTHLGKILANKRIRPQPINFYDQQNRFHEKNMCWLIAYFSHDSVVISLEIVNNSTLCLASSAAMIGSNWLIYFTSQLPKTIKIRNKGISEIFRTIVKVNKYLCEYFVHRSWKCKKSVRARQMPWHDMELKGCKAVGSSRARQSFNTIQLKTKTESAGCRVEYNRPPVN